VIVPKTVPSCACGKEFIEYNPTARSGRIPLLFTAESGAARREQIITRHSAEQKRFDSQTAQRLRGFRPISLYPGWIPAFSFCSCEIRASNALS
jgi:hypothetical protein